MKPNYTIAVLFFLVLIIVYSTLLFSGVIVVKFVEPAVRIKFTLNSFVNSHFQTILLIAITSVLLGFINDVRKKWLSEDIENKMSWVFYALSLLSIFCVYFLYRQENSTRIFGLIPLETNFIVFFVIGLIFGAGYHLKIWGELVLLFSLQFMLVICWVARIQVILDITDNEVTLAYLTICMGVITHVLLTVVWQHRKTRKPSKGEETDKREQVTATK